MPVWRCNVSIWVKVMGLVLLWVHKHLLLELAAVVEWVLIALVEIVVAIISGSVQVVIFVLKVQVIFYLSSLVILDDIGLTTAHHRIAFANLLLILRSHLIHASIHRIWLVLRHFSSIRYLDASVVIQGAILLDLPIKRLQHNILMIGCPLLV